MLALVLHPSETRKPQHRVRASARRLAGANLVTLRFEIEGASHVVWPPSNESSSRLDGGGERRDELWKETCLECFVGGTSASYAEWNFSPNANWAAYHFDGYRSGMKNAEIESAPSIERTSSGDGARFQIDFDISDEFNAGVPSVSLTAVVLEKGDAAPYYWALTHAGPKPDFHLRQSFTLELEC